MGTYLSTPVTDKGKEEGEALDCPTTPCAWAVVDMQGWRKSMEDAHVARTNVAMPPHLLPVPMPIDVNTKQREETSIATTSTQQPGSAAPGLEDSVVAAASESDSGL